MSAGSCPAPCRDEVGGAVPQIPAAIIFLDIDGVLHPVNAEEAHSFVGIRVRGLGTRV